MPIPSGGLEILLLLKFSCSEQKMFEKMKNFVDYLFDSDYSGVNDEEGSDDEAAIVIETDQSKPVSHTAANQSKLVSYTDSSSKEEEEGGLHVDVNFNETLDLVI